MAVINRSEKTNDKSKIAKTTTTTQTPTTPTKSTRMPLYLVLLSGFTTMALLIWGLAWVAMILLIDAQRVNLALERHLIVFLSISIGFIIAICYTQFKLMTNNYHLEERDTRAIAMFRLFGVLFVLWVFKSLFFDVLTTKDVRDLLPETSIVNDINQGI